MDNQKSFKNQVAISEFHRFLKENGLWSVFKSFPLKSEKENKRSDLFLEVIKLFNETKPKYTFWQDQIFEYYLTTYSVESSSGEDINNFLLKAEEEEKRLDSALRRFAWLGWIFLGLLFSTSIPPYIKANFGNSFISKILSSYYFNTIFIIFAMALPLVVIGIDYYLSKRKQVKRREQLAIRIKNVQVDIKLLHNE